MSRRGSAASLHWKPHFGEGGVVVVCTCEGTQAQPAPAAVMEASGVDSHSFLRLSSSNKSPAGLNLSPDGGVQGREKKKVAIPRHNVNVHPVT